MMFPWHLYLMAAMYFVAGLNHFRRPALYVKIIPPFFFNPKLLNAATGAAEMLLAVFLCLRGTSPFAAWGIIILLVAVFPANIYMAVKTEVSLGFPKGCYCFGCRCRSR